MFALIRRILPVMGLVQILLGAALVAAPRADSTDGNWLIQIADGVSAEAVAASVGAEYVRPLRGVPGYHRVRYYPQLESRKAGPGWRDALVRRLEAEPDILQFEEEELLYRYPRQFVPPDPRFPDQWHLENVGQSGGIPYADIRVRPVWDAGLSGAGVVIAVVDEGTQYTHPDLNPNWVVNSGYDYNDDDNDPSPSGDDDRHGTAVAGISLAASNGTGGLGVAHAAGLVPLRLIAGGLQPGEEAEALSYQTSLVDIYNNSWGPSEDFGVRFVDTSQVLKTALANNVATGRGGLGNIYVWAAGNGGLNGDNSNYDGYNASPYTISVGAVGDDGIKAGYSEPGANLLVVAPSRGRGAGIVTTDNTGSFGYAPGDVYDNFSGTSAATPVVSGVVALLLEKRPDLGWRDVQKILALTATPVDFSEDKWERNGAGHWVSHDYGFGRVDAAAAIALAGGWPVMGPPQTANGLSSANAFLPEGQTVSRSVNIARALRVQHVRVRVSINHSDWGDLRIVLESPSGTESVLSKPHTNANLPGSPVTWTFLSTRHLNELSTGSWILHVTDEDTGGSGSLTSWSVEVWGTSLNDSGNRPPAAGDLVIQSTQFPVEVNALDGLSDPDGDSLSLIAVQQPQFGELDELGNGRFRYTIGQTPDGMDMFSILVSDGRGGAARRIVRFLDPRPVGRNDLYPVTAGEATELPVLLNDLDPDEDPLRIVSIGGDFPGTASLTPEGRIRYEAPVGFSGVARIRYELADDSDGSSEAWATVVVQPEPDVALDFDGEDDFLRLPPTPELDLVDNFTVEAWIYPEDWGEYVTGFGRIFDRSTFVFFLNGFDHAFYEDNSLVVFVVLEDGSTTTAANTVPGAVELNKWQHVAVTYSSGNLQPVRIYVNGQRVGITYPIPESTIPRQGIASNKSAALYMGESDSGARAFKGRMSHFAIWNRVLDNVEIAARRNASLTGNEPGLQLYFPLDQTLEPEAVSTGALKLTAEIFEAYRTPPELPWEPLLKRYSTIDDFGNGWWEDRTLGVLYGDAFPWIYIPWLDWVYTGHGPTRSGYALYALHDDWGWLRIVPGEFPWIYRYADQSWLWHLSGTSEPGWIYDFAEPGWSRVGSD